MDPVTIAALIGGAGSLVNAGSQVATNKQNRKFQLEMWNRTNAYNTPLAQRKRMEAAGFNPNMLYGHGTVANTAQQGNVPDGTAPSVGDFGSQYIAAKNLGANLELKKEQSAVSRITAANMVEQGKGYALDNYTKGINAANLLKEGTQKDQAIAKADLDLARYTDFQEENLRLLKVGNDYTESKTAGQDISNQIGQLNLDWLPREKQRAAQKDFAQINNIVEDTNLKRSLQRLQSISGEKLVQEINNLKTSNEGQKLDNVVKKLKAWKSTYGIGDDAFSGILGTVLGVSGSMLEDLGLIDKSKRVKQ